MDNQNETKDIPVQLDELGQLLEELDKNIIVLQERLEPLSRADFVNDKKEDKGTLQQIAPLANLIRDRCIHVKIIIERVDFLRKGLQL